VVLRHFTPDVAHAESPPAAHCGVLWLDRITSSAHLRYRIVHRTSPVEIALYETLRWTDHPDVYIRRALEQHLFEAGGLVQSTSRGDLSLAVDVLGFEQVDAPAAGRVQLAYELRDDRAVVASGTVTLTRPRMGPQIEAVVAAIGEATEAATGVVVARGVVPVVRARAGCGAGT
jgi:ABC-type uncharacterized transport system auxiliary subunit